MIRKKQRVYNKAKRTNNEKHWEEFKLLRKTVKTKLEEAHQNYISKLLEVDEEGERKTPVVGKKFWQYVKSKKRDSCGVAPLISNGKLMEDSKGKAEALNHQFVSVFTDENTSSQPKLNGSPSPDIDHLEITVEGNNKAGQHGNTIKDWNTLPIRLLNIEDAEAFKNSLTSYLTELMLKMEKQKKYKNESRYMYDRRSYRHLVIQK
ncbi:unnamed protein product [Mytilus edulis]|uniref:Uncharacterized protein n=1 Tax=Mytilus edulis TaxID=6550 RepID=A0A8S3RDA7_MYTED|nr:unnamed protein product [Mytilus edulis]